jgi:aminomethyltransferase
MLEPGTSTTLYFGPWYRKSPYFEAARRYRTQAYDLYNRMYIPSHYASPEEEYWHLVNGVTIWDVGCERQVEIAGRDALKFTDYLTPRDLRKCDVGQGKYVLITSEEGGIIGDPVLMRVAKDRFWLSVADSDVLLWAKGVAIHSDMDVEIREPDVSPMQVQGPKSKDVLKALVGPKVLDLPYYHFLETTIDGIPVVVTRTGWSAEVGYEIYLCDGRRGVDLWRRVMEAGKPFNIRPTGPSDIRRIEAGILNYGSDMTLENNPYEVGLGWLVDEGKKADYIGKKALKRIKKEGVKQKLVGVEIDGPPMGSWLREAAPVLHDGREIGDLRASVFSPRLKKNIGYAMVPMAHAKLGTDLTVRLKDGDRRAIVVRKPFLDPSKSTPKS